MDYKIIRSNRRTLCIQIIAGSVVVRSPLLLPKIFIDKFVADKESWIEKVLAQTESANELKPNEIFYLGKRRTLSFGASQVIDTEAIILKSIGETKLEKKKALESFLKVETSRIVRKLLLKYPSFSYRSVKFSHYLSKWGSCSPKNDLTFNIKLAMCPLEVIEYVVVHELCHIKVKNHSSRFWGEVALLMDGYKNNRKWLRKNRWYL